MSRLYLGIFILLSFSNELKNEMGSIWRRYNRRNRMGERGKAFASEWASLGDLERLKEESPSARDTECHEVDINV